LASSPALRVVLALRAGRLPRRLLHRLPRWHDLRPQLLSSPALAAVRDALARPHRPVHHERPPGDPLPAGLRIRRRAAGNRPLRTRPLRTRPLRTRPPRARPLRARRPWTWPWLRTRPWFRTWPWLRTGSRTRRRPRTSAQRRRPLGILERQPHA